MPENIEQLERYEIFPEAAEALGIERYIPTKEREKISDEDQLKVRCTNHHTLAYYDNQGIHTRCRHCKTIHTLSWQKISLMYQEAMRK